MAKVKSASRVDLEVRNTFDFCHLPFDFPLTHGSNTAATPKAPSHFPVVT